MPLPAAEGVASADPGHNVRRMLNLDELHLRAADITGPREDGRVGARHVAFDVLVAWRSFFVRRPEVCSEDLAGRRFNAKVQVLDTDPATTREEPPGREIATLLELGFALFALAEDLVTFRVFFLVVTTTRLGHLAINEEDRKDCEDPDDQFGVAVSGHGFLVFLLP
ncbi:hypothetical protein C0416_03855 [bacterium]|nr:hypothetical protein [bacterium]